ncbi:hypothetical protein AB0L74_12570 [Streptomyces sp. NPDC052020]|uniref:hypothetical protein n=1 Tax=Streptomyces sp. NPDC052020 TaxID=3155677 RepID=UPI00341820DD
MSRAERPAARHDACEQGAYGQDTDQRQRFGRHPCERRTHRPGRTPQHHPTHQHHPSKEHRP